MYAQQRKNIGNDVLFWCPIPPFHFRHFSRPPTSFNHNATLNSDFDTQSRATWMHGKCITPYVFTYSSNIVQNANNVTQTDRVANDNTADRLTMFGLDFERMGHTCTNNITIDIVPRLACISKRVLPTFMQNVWACICHFTPLMQAGEPF